MDRSKTLTYESHGPEAVRRMQKLVLWISAIGFGLYSLVLAPLYTQLNSDVTYQEAVITYVLYYAYNLVQIAVFYAVFAATIYAVWRGGFLGSKAVWITYTLALVGKYLLNFLMDCILDGSIPAFDLFLSKDLPIMLPNLLLEIGQYALILLITCLIIRRKKRKWQVSLLLNESKAGDERALAFPITKLLSFKNPVQASAFWSSVVFMVMMVVSHLIYQLAQLIYMHSNEGELVLITDMITDVFLGIIAYFVMVLLLSSFDRREISDLAEASRGSST